MKLFPFIALFPTLLLAQSSDYDNIINDRFYQDNPEYMKGALENQRQYDQYLHEQSEANEAYERKKYNQNILNNLQEQSDVQQQILKELKHKNHRDQWDFDPIVD